MTSTFATPSEADLQLLYHRLALGYPVFHLSNWRTKGSVRVGTLVSVNGDIVDALDSTRGGDDELEETKEELERLLCSEGVKVVDVPPLHWSVSGVEGAVLLTQKPSISTFLPRTQYNHVEAIRRLMCQSGKEEKLWFVNGITTNPGPWVTVAFQAPVETPVLVRCIFDRGSEGIQIPVGNTYTWLNAAMNDGEYAGGDDCPPDRVLFVDRLVLKRRGQSLSEGLSTKHEPLHDLLDYILKAQPQAKYAVASDREFLRTLQLRDCKGWLPSGFQVWLEVVSPKTDVIEVDGISVGVLTIRIESGNSPAQQQSSGEHTIDEELLMHEDQHAQRRPIIWEPAADGHTGAVTSLAVSPDSQWVASGSDDTTIILWDTEDLSVVRKWEASVDIVWHLAFSPDSQRLACSGSEGRIVIWDVEQGDELGTLEGHTGTVHMVVWSPDGTKLASGSDDMTIRIWDAETYQPIRVLEGHGAMVTFVVFSPDGTLLASGGADYNCRIWVVETSALKHELSGHKGTVWTAAFDPEARRIATASDDGSVRIWSVETGEELVIVHAHTGRVWVVAFTEDGKQIMSASSDSTVMIWDSFSGKCILELAGHGGMVHAAQFSPDGKYIASASSDGTLRLWDSGGGRNLLTLEEHDDKVRQALFSPDGRTLSWATESGKVRVRAFGELIKVQGDGEVEQEETKHWEGGTY